MNDRIPVLRAGPGMGISLEGQAIVFSVLKTPEIVARIIESAGFENEAGNTVYKWIEQQVDASGGGYEDMPGGRNGDGIVNPAVELNNQTVTDNTIVILRERGVGTDYRGQMFYEFAIGGAGAPLLITVVTDITCASGVLQVTKRTYSIPGATEIITP